MGCEERRRLGDELCNYAPRRDTSNQFWRLSGRLAFFVRVVPTELTENTEAYGLKLLESTERIDAARHTTEGTEMIACVQSYVLQLNVAEAATLPAH